MIVKKRAVYIGTIQQEFYGISFDYRKDNLYLMNRFLSYLIQNQDSISERIKDLFSSVNSQIFLSIINKFDEYEVFCFHNLEKINIDDINCDNLNFQIENNFLVLKQIEIELVFPLPINDLVQHNIIFNDEEVEFEKIEEYIGKEVILLSDPDFPHIFMTEPQIKYNNEYLTKVIDELLAEVGLNSSANKTELAKIFGEEFLK